MTTTGTTSPSQWTHVAYVSTGSMLTVYANGNPVYNAARTINPSGAMYIGARVNAPTPNEGFSGLLDDMALWNVALPQASIQQLVSGQANPATLVVAEPVVVSSSTATWRISTASVDGGATGTWDPTGLPDPPSAATFTIVPTATNAGVIPLVNTAATALGVQGLVADNNVRYYRTTFELPPLAAASANIQLAVDNGAAVYINGQLIATETSFAAENWTAPYPTIAIADTGAVTVSKFDSQVGTFTGWLSGENEVIVAVRNPNSETAPAGAVAFKMSVIPTFAAGTTRLDLGPTTYYFRNEFDFAGDTSRTTLSLTTLVDDGAVYYLNGFEVYRQNMPAGAATYDTLSASEIGIPAAGSAVSIPADHLLQGGNVLAVEVHQASVADTDMLFAATLRASTAPIPPDAPLELAFNELAGAAVGDFWVELANRSGATVNLGGFLLASSDETKTPYVLPSQSIPAGGFLALTEAEIGFDALSGDRLFLYRPGQTSLVDAVVVTNRSRGRSPDHGDVWIYPDVPTPGAANHFSLHDDVVINEIMYHPRPLSGTSDTPATYDATPLVPLDADTMWRYNATNTDLGTAWYSTTYNTGENGWLEGPGLIGFEGSALPAPIRTPLANPAVVPFIRTYYFQTTFAVGDTSTIDQLRLRHVIDDGAVFYLNGVEVSRFNLPGNAGEPMPFATVASPGVDNAVFVEDLAIPVSRLIPNAVNVLSVEVHQGGTSSTDIVFGAELSARRQLTPFIPGEPFRESDQQWIELYNRSTAAVDLTEWELGGGIDYEFAPGTMLGAGQYIVVARDVAAMQAAHPTINVVGPFSGRLSQGGDRVVLRDAVDNPADEVRYFDSGRWHEYADGGGSSLELIDPDSDNTVPQAWDASDESDAGAWQTVTYRGVATASSVGPDGLWQEFLLGLLDAGEVLLDDIRVTQNPSTTPVQLIQNGSFQSEVVGSQPATWRVLGTHGTHGQTVVDVDPGDPTNKVLHLVATGASEHIYNHIETTLKNGAAIATISNGTEYEISYRVKHLAGDLQVNTRLYFNRLPKTTILTTPPEGGTPGAENSRYRANVGPTYTDFVHSPAVPPAGSPVTVSAVAADPDGVASMTLWYSVNSGAWQSTGMSLGADGKFAATIPGQAAGAVVQFYAEGTDGLGAVSTYPAEGRGSRALYQVDDGRERLGGPNDVHNVRLVMTPNDANLLHAPTNAMSNDRIGATVIYDERTIYYDVGVRLKGSERGRRQDVRISFNVQFQPDQLFRGVHDNIAIDRSGAGDQFSQKEIIVEHIVTHAGDIPGEYSDLIHVITPRSTHTGSAMLMMARYGNVFLDSQYDNGGDGTLFEYELIYYPAGTTDGNPESPKLPYPSPDGVVGVSIGNLGNDKENYRWPFLIKNNRDADDYSRLIDMAKTFSLSGASYNAQIDSVIDVDQWLRAFAVGILTGIGDSYFGGAQHNLEVYVRPDDQRVLLFPHDMDFSFSAGTTSSLTPNGDLNKMLAIPGNRHHYYGHVHDIVTTTFNATYMTPWINHYDSLLPAESFASFISYIANRSVSALSQISAAIPQVSFAITTNGGNDFTVNTPTTTLQGTGWVNVRTIRVAGEGQPLPVTWINDNTWQLTLPVDFGANSIVLEAVDFQGNLIASDTVTI
ncbi:MAG: lamin tail domain-containing protein, partial [Pirellulales bacterium]